MKIELEENQYEEAQKWVDKKAEELENVYQDRKYRQETEEVLKFFEDKRKLSNRATTSQQSYKGNKNRRVKALIAAILVTAGIGYGAYKIPDIVEDQKAYHAIEEVVKNYSNEQIRDRIYSVLEGEITDATHEQKVEIDQYMVDTGTKRTQVKVGKMTYTEDLDLRSPVSTKNTLKSGSIGRIITETRDAEKRKDRKGLIRSLRDAIKFANDKDLTVEGDTLKEKDVER